MSVTAWFPPDIKPVRVGVYERANCAGGRFSRWNGHYWETSFDGDVTKGKVVTPRYRVSGFRSMYQQCPWRGRAKS
jgi:hypothetical protein